MSSYMSFWGVGGERRWGAEGTKYCNIMYWPAPGLEQAIKNIAENKVK